MCRPSRRAERCAGDDGIEYCGRRNVSHFFPAVRGVNKPATFWDWFIPVITCVFCAASLNQTVNSNSFPFFYFCWSGKNPIAKYRSLFVGQKKYVFQLHHFPGLSGGVGQPMGKTGTATNLSGSLKFQSCQFIHPTRRAQCHKYIPPTCSREITSS